MEIKISSKQIFNVLLILCWIIFIGVLFEAGAIICYTILKMVIDPSNAHRLWKVLDLTDLFYFNKSHYLTLSIVISIVALMKAFMFYLIIKVLHRKDLTISQPFNQTVRKFILNVAYLALGIGLFSDCGKNFIEWLIQEGVKMPDLESLKLGGADVWIFMSIILFVIAYIFKKGIELQEENDLTV